MFSCTRANLKYQHKHVKENRSCVRFKIWIWANTFSRKKKEFPYTAAIVSINRCFSLSNDDGDVNKNVTKATGLDWQNNNFALATRVFVPFFSLPSLHDYDVKLPISRFLRDVNTGQQLSIYFPEHQFNSRKNCQHLTKWSRWNKRDKVWSSVFSYPSTTLLLKLSNTNNPCNIFEQQS